VAVALLAVFSIGSGATRHAVLNASAAAANSAYPVHSEGLTSTESFWTTQAMRAAQPVRKVITGADSANASRVTVGHGAPSSVAPVGPAQGSSAASATSDGAPAAPSDAVPQQFPGTDAYNYPPPAANAGAVKAMGIPFTSFPWAPNGALFFHDPVGGGFFRCSAAIINSQNLSVLFTAGHCVANGGNAYFYNDFAFCPAYDASLGSPCPLGVWTARGAWTWSTWFFNGTLALDLGVLVLNCSNGTPGNNVGGCPFGGAPAVGVTGGEGIAFNQSVVQHFWDVGYPAAPPYNGCCMDLSTASSNHLDTAQGSPATIGIGSNFTGGSSGGQWYIFFSGGGGYANGHNDYIYLAQPLQMFSPYYGNEAALLYTAAATT
jgi:hypothetical protein